MKWFLFALMLVPTPSGIFNMDNISRAISAGDVSTLEKYFDETVEIAILGDEDIFERARATDLLKTFFAKNQPKAFSQVHQGASKSNDSIYCIGNLTTSAGLFRVYIYLHTEDDSGKYLIQELRFDKEE